MAAGAVDRLTTGSVFALVAKVELSLGDSKRNFTGYGLPASVTRSPGTVNRPLLLFSGKSPRTDLSNAFQAIDPGEQIFLRFWRIELVAVRHETVQNIGHAHWGAAGFQDSHNRRSQWSTGRS
jgi:hypothetical protein